ncbi:hypothetical protein [Aeromonas sp. 1HA1]|uniref:hypothetical protein n=1 Tax=Aeromonas sp. 1HA1 TaxID=2699193 RepID=UPI0023DD6D83|nr:hypothetical protein [Aeromonas sp. 1HA1]MDF2415455.1 hypothetical protein [Aeromonas sp. 1HA1]
MKDSESPYPGAVIVGLGVVMPHPSQPEKFVLPGGIICNRHNAEKAAQKLHVMQITLKHQMLLSDGTQYLIPPQTSEQHGPEVP